MKKSRLNDRERAMILIADGEIITQHIADSGAHWIIKAYGQIWLVERDRRGKYSVRHRNEVTR